MVVSFHRCLAALLLSSFTVFTSATLLSINELWQKGEQLWQSSDFDSTLAVLQTIERLKPGDRRTLLSIAAVYQRQKKFDQAVDALNVLLVDEPHDLMLLQVIGEIYTEKREIPKALEFLHSAERMINPTNIEEVDALTHRFALAYLHGKDFVTAETFFNRVSIGGRSADFYFDYGVTLEKLGKILEAGDAYNEALAIDPTQAYARINIAVLHHQHGDVHDSIPQYLSVINSPSAPQSIKIMAMGNVGVAYELTKDIINALHWYERAFEELANSPSDASADRFSTQTSQMHLKVHMVRAKLSACVWKDSEDEFDSLWAIVVNVQIGTGASNAFTPFDSLLHEISPQDRKLLAIQFSTKFTTGVIDKTVKPREDTQLTRLNVGYLSYDFSDHPTTHLMEGVFATRDRDSIKSTAFGYGRDDGSAFRQRVIDNVDQFFDLSSASFEESVKLIRNERIHIIMDAQVHTSRGRFQIVAARPAPIVVNYLVYPGTSGAPFVDYVIVDRFVVPPAELSLAFTEKLVVLANCYQVNYYDQVLATSKTISQRSDLWKSDQEQNEQMIEDGFVFVNFNKIDKLKASVFSTWMTILRRVPRSSLLLLDPGTNRPNDTTSDLVTSREIKKNLWNEARTQGIPSGRIRFVSRIPKVEHLQRHRFGGLFLDTFIYGAHSTATDALYAGLPVLTLAGDSFASRVCVSLLENLGMPELISFSVKEYEDLAVYLAKTPSVFARLQHRLRSDKTEFEQPLFRTKQHTQHLEASQRLMYDIYLLANRTFHVVV
ncbi:putative UDP-N-acetylglucosamine--peptide N-acetylglucosaminyltransferase SEC [Phytophthora citrophthora]|uniref:protein O-GlcNAc transferase n=1 Tax=Phytophthora citrophthora TaxID=4793 RepID=A0AAD9GKU6_9STRA|nr:putative UDP-N-acetylglucosamine--peptide N-acetylglucosaminyltransferase SEC [Phytophthora citrophthora]